jgi:hypothetical protein
LIVVGKLAFYKAATACTGLPLDALGDAPIFVQPHWLLGSHICISWHKVVLAGGLILLAALYKRVHLIMVQSIVHLLMNVRMVVVARLQLTIRVHTMILVRGELTVRIQRPSIASISKPQISI